jgi:hypothetical protein
VADLDCGDPYPALLERQGGVARLLIRFTGPGHNACGSALYAMRVVLPNADARTRVMVYRQDNVPGPIELVGSALADGDDADCARLTEYSTGDAWPRDEPRTLLQSSRNLTCSAIACSATPPDAFSLPRPMATKDTSSSIRNAACDDA